MMIYELFLLCSFEIMLDFCSALFKVVRRSDFLKNMVLKSALNLNIWKPSVKVNPYGRSGPSLIPARLGPRSFTNLWSVCVCMCAHNLVCFLCGGSQLCWVSYLLFFPVREPGVSVLSFWVGAVFIFLTVTKPQKGKTKQSLTIKKCLEKSYQ